MIVQVIQSALIQTIIPHLHKSDFMFLIKPMISYTNSSIDVTNNGGGTLKVGSNVVLDASDGLKLPKKMTSSGQVDNTDSYINTIDTETITKPLMSPEHTSSEIDARNALLKTITPSALAILTEMAWREECLTRARAYTMLWDDMRPAGMIRAGHIPKKVVCIGNSITMHAPESSYPYNVMDYRAMAAQYPDHDWVSIVYKVLHEINPDVLMYKANGATWETDVETVITDGVITAYKRSYDKMKDNPYCKVETYGPDYVGGHLDDILDEDVDLIICQLYENIGDMFVTSAELRKHYIDLYAKFKEKCPKAWIYQFDGFWRDIRKDFAILSAIGYHGMKVIFPVTMKIGLWHEQATGDNDAYRLQIAAGDVMHYVNRTTGAWPSTDTPWTVNDGNPIIGHPNSAGFRMMAFYTLDRLFNDRTDDSLVPMWGPSWFVSNTDLPSMLKSRNTYPTHDLNPGLNNDTDFDYLLMRGKYFCSVGSTAGTSFGTKGHGILHVFGWNVDASTGSKTGYSALIQRYYNLNFPDSDGWIRHVNLSATRQVWTEWKQLCSEAPTTRTVWIEDEVHETARQYKTLATPEFDFKKTSDNYQHLRKDSSGAIIYKSINTVIKTLMVRIGAPSTVTRTGVEGSYKTTRTPFVWANGDTEAVTYGTVTSTYYTWTRIWSASQGYITRIISAWADFHIGGDEPLSYNVGSNESAGNDVTVYKLDEEGQLVRDKTISPLITYRVGHDQVTEPFTGPYMWQDMTFPHRPIRLALGYSKEIDPDYVTDMDTTGLYNTINIAQPTAHELHIQDDIKVYIEFIGTATHIPRV